MKNSCWGNGSLKVLIRQKTILCYICYFLRMFFPSEIVSFVVNLSLVLIYKFYLKIRDILVLIIVTTFVITA